MRRLRYYVAVCARLCGNFLVLDHLGTNGVQGSGQSGQKSVRFIGNRSFGGGVGGNGLTLGFGNLARDELVESFIGFGNQGLRLEGAEQRVDQRSASGHEFIGDGERGALHFDGADFAGVEQGVQHQTASTGTHDDVVFLATHFELRLTNQTVDFHDLQKQGVADDGRSVGVLVLLVRVRSQNVGLVEEQGIDFGEGNELRDGDGLIGLRLRRFDVGLGDHDEAVVANFDATFQVVPGNDLAVDGVLLGGLYDFPVHDGDEVEAGTFFTGCGVDLGFKIGESTKGNRDVCDAASTD